MSYLRSLSVVASSGPTMSRGRQITSNHLLLLPLLLVIGLLFRILPPLLSPHIYYSDGIFQTLEPAHRLWFGSGIVTFEWTEGMRSWLFPGALAMVMAATERLGPGAYGYLFATYMLLALLSLAVVVVGYLFGNRLFGKAGAVTTGGICVVWYELVYFAPTAFNEVVAGNILVIGVYLRIWQFAIAGLFFGLAGDLRFHIYPMIVVAIIFVCRGEIRRRWLPLLAGLIVPVLALAILDAQTLGTPLQSVWKNFWINIVQGRAQVSGTAPFYWYATQLILIWGAAVVPIAAAVAIGARRLPMLAGMILIHVIAHSVIAHKEMRFLYPIMPLIVILIGIGTSEVVIRLTPEGRGLDFYAGSAVAAWGIMSLAIAVGYGFRANLTQYSEGLLAMEDVGLRQGVCGLGLAVNWWDTGGYTYSHLSVPMYWVPGDISELYKSAASFNYALVPKPLSSHFEGFELLRCWDPGRRPIGDPRGFPLCLLRRAGNCNANPNFEINKVLAGIGLSYMPSVLPVWGTP